MKPWASSSLKVDRLPQGRAWQWVGGMAEARKAVRWARGFFRLWLVVALCWIVLTGWIAYQDYPSDSGYFAGIALGSERFTAQQVEAMKQRAADAGDIEAVNRFNQLLESKADEMRDRRAQHVSQYRILIGAPPLVLLLCGGLVAWIIRGFRAT